MQPERFPKTRTEIERLLLAELRDCDDCGGARAVTVMAWGDDGDTGPTWTVDNYDIGSADAYDCQMALDLIVPRFQSFYDLVQKH
jgi:hypothetical protein